MEKIKFREFEESDWYGHAGAEGDPVIGEVSDPKYDDTDGWVVVVDALGCEIERVEMGGDDTKVWWRPGPQAINQLIMEHDFDFLNFELSLDRFGFKRII